MDAYDRKARLYPAFIVIAPITLLAALLFSLKWWSGLAGVAATTGLHVLVVTLVRDRGASVQPSLWESWGGRPSTVRMTWSHATNPLLHQRRLDAIQNATRIAMPTAAEEADDRDDAMQRYDAAAQLLPDLTRDETRHPRVKIELTNYGFRRNPYGCRPLGFAAALIALAAELGLTVAAYRGDVGVSLPLVAGGGVLSAAWVLLWWRIVTPEFVRRDADRYADALINAAADTTRQ